MSTVSEAVKKSIKKQTEFLPKLLNVSTIPSLRTDEIFTNLLIQRGRKPVGKVEYTGRRDRLVDYSRVSGTQVKESQEIYVFGQSMMRVTPNAFFSPEKQESEKVSFVKSCFEIGLMMNYLSPAQETGNFQILCLRIC